MKKLLNTKLKDIKAITLIALVITIVVLIILAGVIISITIGNGGIIDRAKKAKQEYANAEGYEKEQIEKVSNSIEKIATSTRDFDIKDLELNYTNKVNISLYNSSSNTYTVPSAGIIVVSGYTNAGATSYINVGGINIRIWGGASNEWDDGSYSQVVTKQTNIFFDIGNGGNIENAYFIPFK